MLAGWLLLLRLSVRRSGPLSTRPLYISRGKNLCNVADGCIRLYIKAVCSTLGRYDVVEKCSPVFLPKQRGTAAADS